MTKTTSTKSSTRGSTKSKTRSNVSSTGMTYSLHEVRRKIRQNPPCKVASDATAEILQTLQKLFKHVLPKSFCGTVRISGTPRTKDQHAIAKLLIEQWQRRFRVLRDWKIGYDCRANLKAQCSHNYKTRRATIYAWPKNTPVADEYYLHEILHVAIVAIRNPHRTSQWREMDELLIQDLCRIVFP
jgi:hypothetical protein